MTTQQRTTERAAILTAAAHIRPMMGIDVLEPIPAHVPYELTDPFLLVHEATVPINPERGTTHAHRGFDNLWYILSGSTSTGHSTGPDGTFERAHLAAGDLLKIRTGRGVYHAEGIGADQLLDGQIGEFHSVLFWVNLARSSKGVEPTAQVVRAKDLPTRSEGLIERTLVGPGSPVELGTPGLVLDVQLAREGRYELPIAPEFNAFVWMLDGSATIGRTQRRVGKSQMAVLGPGAAVSVASATSGTRFMLMAGKPYGEQPIYNGPFVD